MLDDFEKHITDTLESMNNKKHALEAEYIEITNRQLEIKAELSTFESSLLRTKSRIGFIPEVEGVPNCINCFITHGSNIPLSEIGSDDNETALLKCKECGRNYNSTP